MYYACKGVVGVVCMGVWVCWGVQGGHTIFSILLLLTVNKLLHKLLVLFLHPSRLSKSISNTTNRSTHGLCHANESASFCVEFIGG